MSAQMTLEILPSTEYIDSPNKPDVIDWDKAYEGRRLAQKTARWIKANPTTFETFCSLLGGIRRSDSLRDRVKIASEDAGVKLVHDGHMFDHSLFAPMLRYAVKKYPQLEGHPVKFTKYADIDHSGIVPIEEVGIG